MTIYDFTDYRPFIRAKFAQSPRKGRGKLLELSNYLKMHATVVSQIFSGQRGFSEEQAIEICEFLDLTPEESSYLRLLVRFDMAHTHKLKSAIKTDLTKARTDARSLKSQVRPNKFLNDTERSVFYSSCLYSAARLYCSTHKAGRSAEEVAVRFSIPRAKAMKVLEFLVQCGLIGKTGEKFVLGLQTTYLPEESPFYSKHHSNWRIKSIELNESRTKDELTFTGPFSVSKADFEEIRKLIAETIKKFSSIVKDSDAEEVACLNIDLFWAKK